MEPYSHYTKLETRRVGQRLVTAWYSTEPDDPAWDDFLRQAVLGQFQQSSMWARAKQSEGWHPFRVLITCGDWITGGFQILWRRSKSIRIGYVSKGPVAHPEEPDLIDFLLDLLRQVVRKMRLAALIIQAPDLNESVQARLPKSLFLSNVLMKINDATLVISLDGTFEAVERRVQKNRKTRQTIQQAIKKGVIIREGLRSDIATFFQLMLSTCKRQGAKPNPGSVEPLYSLWDAAKPWGCIRISLAEYDGKTLAGVLCIPFGDTVVAWKKGWTSSGGELHPNDLLMYDAIKWAHEHGYRYFDFAALDRNIATALLYGQSLSADQKASRHFFNLRFGGRPRLLPSSLIYFPNVILRSAYVLFLESLSLGGKVLKSQLKDSKAQRLEEYP